MKRIVVIGGGTGSYHVLSGLKRYTTNLTAIVTVMDSGGSSGVLRDEFGTLPPGDMRRAIIALSEDTEVMKRLFEYRFDNGSIKGHNLGNLILTALTNIYGSEATAVKEASRILNIKGKVLPVTLDNSTVCAELEDGTIVKGETNIDVPKHDGTLAIRRIYLEPTARLYAECYDALRDAECIVIGPGDLYSSILPNFLVEGMVSAIKASKAKKVFVCNVMTKFGETTGFSASDFLARIEERLGPDVLDAIIVNSTLPQKENAERYAAQKQYPVRNDLPATKGKTKVLATDLLKEPILVRHDPDKLARVIMAFTDA